MLKVALRNVRAHFVRLGLSILAVVLGVSFVAGTFALREMLSDTFNGIVDAGTTGDVYLRGATEVGNVTQDNSKVGESRGLIDANLVETIEQVPGVERADASFQGPIIVVGADGTAVGSGSGAPSFAIAYSNAMDSSTLSSGRVPTEAGEFALDASTAKRSGLAVGDTTKLIIGGEIKEATLTGVLDMGSSFAGATIAILDDATAAATYAPDGLVSTIVAYANDGVSPDSLATAIDDAVTATSPEHPAEVLTGDAMRSETRDAIGTMLGFVETFLLIFAGISLFVGGFIIANTFAMTVRQRQREFALLRAIGASPLQVFTSILAQAAIVGFIGGILGVFGGLGLVLGLKALFSSMGMDLAGDLPVNATMVIVALIVGIGVSVLSAALPARRAALVPPVEAMREDGPAQGKSLRIRGIVGLVLFGGGVGAVLSAFLQASNDETASTGGLLGLGAVAVVIGVLFLAPVVAKSALKVMAWPFVVLIRPLGKLARGNVTRNPRRTASTASALMIGMALVGAASVLASSTQATMSSIVETESRADLIVWSMTQTVPSEAVAKIEALPEVGRADALTVSIAAVTGPNSTGSTPEQLVLGGMPGDAFGKTWQVDSLSGDISSISSGALAVQEAIATGHGWKVGDELTLTTQFGTISAPIGAIIDSAALGASLIVPPSVIDQIDPHATEQVNTLFLLAADGVTQDQLRAAVTPVAAPYLVLSVMDNDEFISQLASQVNQILVILYALLGLSIVIAILGIVNTLALSVIERTREIGLMRAVGLGRAQLAGTIVIESVLTAVFGTILGLAIGITLASTIPTVFASSGLTDLAIPWSSMALMLGISVLVGVFAALFPAIRAARLPVLEAVTVD